MSLMSVDDALALCLSGVEPMAGETVPLTAADRRVLAQDLAATRTQPPFDVSAMDGFAVRQSDAVVGARLKLIGQSAAGHGFRGTLGAGQAIRIFTGAPVPDGADAILLQENAKYTDTDVDVIEGGGEARHIRRAGIDFAHGQVLLPQDTVLGPRALTLAAAMGHAALPVRRRPKVALIATGDELVMPGETIGPDQIVCSNPFGIAAMLERAGAQADFIGIARDTESDLTAHLDRAREADLVITIGGASVGDHDLVGPVLRDRGAELAFWKIAMRPGKPLMFARHGAQRILGLPGNPVSSLICARVFAVPLIHALLGRPQHDARPLPGKLAAPLEANGPRRHYMRAISQAPVPVPVPAPVPTPGDETLTLMPVASQDSSLLATLNTADSLIVREPHAPAAQTGAGIVYLKLDF